MKSGMGTGGIPALILLYKQVTLFFPCVSGAVVPSASTSERNKSVAKCVSLAHFCGEMPLHSYLIGNQSQEWPRLFCELVSEGL